MMLLDDAVKDFVECLTSASQCMIKKCHMEKHIKGAAWCDDECKKAKKESKEKLRTFRRTREPDHRKEYADSNKRYRRMTRGKKQRVQKKQSSISGHQLEKCVSVLERTEESLVERKEIALAIKLISVNGMITLKVYLVTHLTKQPISRMSKKTM